jgi:hypothetical protein
VKQINMSFNTQTQIVENKGFSRRLNITCLRKPEKSENNYNRDRTRIVRNNRSRILSYDNINNNINVTCGNGTRTECNKYTLGCRDNSNSGPCNQDVLTCQNSFPTGPVSMSFDNKKAPVTGYAARVDNDIYVRFPYYCGGGPPDDPKITQNDFNIQAREGLRPNSLPTYYPNNTIPSPRNTNPSPNNTIPSPRNTNPSPRNTNPPLRNTNPPLRNTNLPFRNTNLPLRNNIPQYRNNVLQYINNQRPASPISTLFRFNNR